MSESRRSRSPATEGRAFAADNDTKNVSWVFFEALCEDNPCH